MSESENETSKIPGKESFVQRVGLIGLLGGAAALITAIATLISAFNKPGPSTEATHPQTPSVAAVAANPAANLSTGPSNNGDTGFAISDYWSGIPDGTSQPLTFHVFVDRKAVLGTLRNPCQSDLVAPIESGTWDGGHLIVHVSKLGSKEPVTLDVNRAGDRLEGSVVQIPYDGHITLRRGEVPCPESQSGKPQRSKSARKD